MASPAPTPSPRHRAPWAAPADAVLRALQSDGSRGLPAGVAAARLAADGPNAIPAPAGRSLLALVADQFRDQLVLILLAAAAVSFALALAGDAADRAGALVEPLVILLILFANAVVGVLQERNAEEAIAGLKEFQADRAVVLRDARRLDIPATNLVVGDVVVVSVGEKVPADARVVAVDASCLVVDQSVVTGESVGVSKSVHAVGAAGGGGQADDGDRLVLQDKTCMVFSGTTVSRGRARAVVVATGMETEIGRIHAGVAGGGGGGGGSGVDGGAGDDDDGELRTPLKIKLDEFADFLSKVILVVCILVWLVNVGNFSSHGTWLNGAVYYFKIAIALAVAAIPEGLPAVVTTCLALGAKSMARKNAIVRHLPSVETLGCTTVICSDKTGTLTTNMMTVQRVAVADAGPAASGVLGLTEYAVGGAGLAMDGGFAPVGGPAAGSTACEKEAAAAEAAAQLDPAVGNPLIAEAAYVATLCNDSAVAWNAERAAYDKVGEGTEVALTVFAEKAGMPSAEACAARRAAAPVSASGADGGGKGERVSKAQGAAAAAAAAERRGTAVRQWWTERAPKSETLEFTRDRKSMSVMVQDETRGGERRLLVKGAPESVVERCEFVRTEGGGRATLDAAGRAEIAATVERWSSGSSALRCLALAVRDDAPPLDFDLADTSRFAGAESGLTFVGVVGMVDPPRPEVRDAIASCHSAGIRVIVITGDNKATGEAVCRRVGVFGEHEDVRGKSFTGREFDALSPAEQQDAVAVASLFARVEPMHKSKLVDMLRRRREVVAMSGDGVNDAPALKKADIGIAMGSGTAVAKDVSSMVLADDNFATIVAAVEEGRSIYANMKQFIRYLISSNIGEVWCIFLTALLGMPEALIPVQLLWVNLVTDGLPATALSFNKADKDIMKEKPRGLEDSIIDGWLFFRYMVIGTYVGIATVGGFAYWFLFYGEGPQMTWHDLTHFQKCVEVDGRPWGCDVFQAQNASTVALTVLVLIEMLNALNSLSENQSVLSVSPLSNPLLLVAIALSLALHAVILYIPFFARIFAVTPLTAGEWMIVWAWSAPVILVDEVLKAVTRFRTARHEAAVKKSD